jgi:hypothetical protein
MGESVPVGAATGDLGLAATGERGLDCIGERGLEGTGERGLEGTGDRGRDTTGDLGKTVGGEAARGSGARLGNKSSLGSMTASLLGWIGGDERLELVTDAAPVFSKSARVLAGDGERRLQSTLLGLTFSLCCKGERDRSR